MTNTINQSESEIIDAVITLTPKGILQLTAPLGL